MITNKKVPRNSTKERPRITRAFHESRRINVSVDRGGILVEVLITLLLFASTSAYLLSSNISARVLWETILETQINQKAVNNSSRTAYVNDDVDQQWSDIAVFGTPSLLSTPP